MPTVTKTQTFPRDAYPVSSVCKWFFGCVQTDGDIRNAIPGKSVASKQVAFLDNNAGAGCWDIPGFAQIGGGAQNFATIQSSTSNLESLATHDLVLVLWLKKTAVAKPAAEGFYFASYQPGQAPFGGIILSMLTTGALRMYVNTTDNSNLNFATAADVLTTGAAAPRVSVVFSIIGSTAYIAVNGVETVSTSAAAVAGKAIASGRNARLGLSLPGTNQPDAVGIEAFGAYCLDRSKTTLNRSAVYDWVLRNPNRAVPEWVFGL